MNEKAGWGHFILKMILLLHKHLFCIQKMKIEGSKNTIPWLFLILVAIFEDYTFNVEPCLFCLSVALKSNDIDLFIMVIQTKKIAVFATHYSILNTYLKTWLILRKWRVEIRIIVTVNNKRAPVTKKFFFGF